VVQSGRACAWNEQDKAVPCNLTRQRAFIAAQTVPEAVAFVVQVIDGDSSGLTSQRYSHL
jgi:hypothetical protein